MSKSLKRAAVIVGVAAFAWATAGVGLLIAGGSTVAGALGATTVLGLSAATIATFGLGLIAIGTAPSLGQEQTGANSRGTVYVDPNALGTYVFGTTAAPLNVIYEQLHGVNEDRVSNVMAHAWHEVETYSSLSVEGETVSFSGDLATGEWAGIVEWRRRLGTQVQSAISISEVAGGEFFWPSTATGTGVAHSALTWNFFNDPDGNKISGAVPTKVDIVVEGAMLYDPREDNAYGSGSQDFEDISSWTFNNGNAALVLLRFIIGEYNAAGDLIWGRGALESDIDMDTFVAMANVADETLDGVPRFQLGGMHLLDGSFEGFVRVWEDETGGKLSKSGGLYRVWLPNDDLTPLTTITDADLLNDIAIGHSAGDIANLYNCARGRYIEPADGHRGVAYPEVTEPTAIAEDGQKRVLFQEFSWVQSVTIAQRIARIKVRRSRFQRVWTVAVGWKGQGPNYRPFTVHTLTTKETGLDAQLVRVVERRISPSGHTLLVLQQEHEAIYDETLGLGDPHASNTISNRLDRFRSGTPRWIDGRRIGILDAQETDEPADDDISYPLVTQPQIEASGLNGQVTYTASDLNDARVTVAWSGQAQIDVTTSGVAVGTAYIGIRVLIDAVEVFDKKLPLEPYTSEDDWGAFSGQFTFTVPAGEEIDARLQVFREFSTSGTSPAQTISWRDSFLSLQAWRV